MQSVEGVFTLGNHHDSLHIYARQCRYLQIPLSAEQWQESCPLLRVTGPMGLQPPFLD
jgi:hypothetical protein